MKPSQPRPRICSLPFSFQTNSDTRTPVHRDRDNITAARFSGHAVESIALIESAVAENRLDVQSAQDLIGMINAYIAGKNIMEIAELQERLANIEQAIAAQPASSQTVHVQGGMPALPAGTNITMPRLNGNEVRQLQTHSSALGEPSVSFEEREHAPVVHEDLPKSTTIEATAGEPPPNEAE